MENEVRESESVVPRENAFEPITMDVESMEFDFCKISLFSVIVYDSFLITVLNNRYSSTKT